MFPMTEGVKSLPWEAIDKEGKETTMFESGILIPWEVLFLRDQSAV